jgi:uncharacterized protein (UPF0210 family)
MMSEGFGIPISPTRLSVAPAGLAARSYASRTSGAEVSAERVVDSIMAKEGSF